MNRTRFLLMLLTIAFFSCKNSEQAQEEEAKAPLVTAKYGCAPKTVDIEWYKKDNIAPIIDGLDVLHYPITTNNPEVQKYFDQGLVLSYGFNHAEAARSFYYATKLDPQCAMCYWGFALVLGPNYNAGMEPDNYQRAWDAIQKAIAVSENVSKKEKRS